MNLISVGLVAAVQVAGTPAVCPPAGMTRAALLDLRAAKFEVASDAARNQTAVSLLGCLDDADPTIRDGVVFEGLQTWLRGKKLGPATVDGLRASLVATLRGPKETAGFRHPFAALVLSEVARVDRIEATFSDAQRSELVDVAVANLRGVDDYRAFDPKDGWRHGVAHGADLVLQLAINPKVGADDARRLMDAIVAQIAPKGAPGYTAGEPERLARAVVFTHRRGVLPAEYWTEWFAAVTNPAPLASWRDAFSSVEGLAKRHNATAFLLALGFAGRQTGGEAGLALAALAEKALVQIGG